MWAIFHYDPVYEGSFMGQVLAEALKLKGGAVVAGRLSFNLLQVRCASSRSTYTFEQTVTVTTMGGVGCDY